MKSWKEEVYGINGLAEDDYNIMDHGNVDFNRDDWLDQKEQYFKTTRKRLSAEDLYNYAIMSIKYAQTHNIEDWFNRCNETQTYKGIAEDYDKEDADKIYRNVRNAYNSARRGIIKMSATYDLDLEELEDQGLIENLRDRGSYYTFKPVVLV